MPLIEPPETVTADIGAMLTIIYAIRAAGRGGTPLREEIREAADLLHGMTVSPATLVARGPMAAYAPAEPVWWLVQGGEEIGHEHGLTSLCSLFDAVDRLGIAIAEQAPRTDYGMVALMEAETVVAFAAAREDHGHE